jgi:hypothetical protein
MNFTKIIAAAFFSAVAITTQAAQSFSEGGIYYTVTSELKHEVSVERQYGVTYEGSVVIPDEVEYNDVTYKVTAIGRGAFYSCTDLSSITIGANVATIGVSAFAGCLGLTAINVSDNNTTLSSDDGVLFNKDKSLLIKYPAAHAGSSYDVPDGTVELDIQSFDYTFDLETVTFPSTLTTIGAYAFMDSGITEVDLPDSVTDMGEYAFYECVSLTKASLGAGMTVVPEFAFNSCQELADFSMRGVVTEIGQYSFFQCKQLTSFPFQDSFVTIGSGAFKSCESLRNATIGKNVTTLGLIPFSFCKSMRKISVDAENPYFCDLGGVLCNKEGTKIIEYPAGMPGEYEVPEQITEIADHAFYYCTRLTEITLNEGLTTIGDDAFHACSEIVSFDIPESVTSIGKQVFMFCDGLKTVTIGKSVSSIGSLCFSMCDVLRTINCNPTTPPELESTNAFSDDAYLFAKLNVPAGCADAYSSAEGWEQFSHINEAAGLTDLRITAPAAHIVGGRLEISGTMPADGYSVYSLNGTKVYSGKESSIDLPGTGLYIVNLAGQPTKLANF